jgi:hypothetical protein
VRSTPGPETACPPFSLIPQNALRRSEGSNAAVEAAAARMRAREEHLEIAVTIIAW